MLQEQKSDCSKIFLKSTIFYSVSFVPNVFAPSPMEFSTSLRAENIVSMISMFSLLRAVKSVESLSLAELSR